MDSGGGDIAFYILILALMALGGRAWNMLSLCPRGLPLGSNCDEGERFDVSDESSCERVKKSSSASYGDDSEFIW